MILLLGKNDTVEQYAKDSLKVDIQKDMGYWPDITTHYTELYKYINIAKETQPPVITTQNLEMINTLLDSDLDFDIVTVKRIDDEIRVRIMSKEDANKNRAVYAIEFRG